MVTGLGRLWPLKGGGYVAGALGARGRKVASTLPVLFPPPEKSDTFTIFGETGVASPDTLSAEGDNAETLGVELLAESLDEDLDRVCEMRDLRELGFREGIQHAVVELSGSATYS